jgi:uncharacterized membrane protein
MRIKYFAVIFKMWLQNKLMWQYDEFSLDIGIKLFYINIISFGLINLILLFSATFFSYICTILYDIFTNVMKNENFTWEWSEVLDGIDGHGSNLELM